MHDSFIQEMRILSKLRHPCITTVMGAVLGKRPLLVMEFMENGSLRDLLSNKTFPLDPELTLPLIRDVLQGIRFLHSATPSIVHGDLKASNVLVDANFRAKIADFGLSARCTAVGTPYYMAPELLRGSPISTQSDVYSFGVLLWEVMTHKVPYDEIHDLSHEQIIELVAQGKLRPDCQEGLDPELVLCMEECWAQKLENRPTLEELEMKLIPLCGQNLFLVMQERNKDAKKQSSLLQDVFPEHIAKALLAGKKVTPEHHEMQRPVARRDVRAAAVIDENTVDPRHPVPGNLGHDVMLYVVAPVCRQDAQKRRRAHGSGVAELAVRVHLNAGVGQS